VKKKMMPLAPDPKLLLVFLLIKNIPCVFQC
jgi:hypothetical protein